MDRILLYYPSINIPDESWLRASILYTDKVSSILPFRDLDDPRINDDTRMLYDQGQYDPIYVFETLNPYTMGIEEFEANLIDTFESDDFQRLQQRFITYKYADNRGYHDYEMYANKITDRVSDYLRHRGLLVNSDGNGEVRVEELSAMIYMSRLADLLARASNDFVIPSTDQLDYERLAFQLADDKSISCRIQFEDCFPTPAPNIPLAKLVDFKKKRHQELLHFRKEIDAIQKLIKEADDNESRKHIMIGFRERIEMGVKEIQNLLGDSKLEYVLKGFSSLLDMKQPAIAGTMSGIGLASIGVIASMPLIGIGAATLMLVGTLVSSYQKINRQRESNAFSYVFYAQKEGLLRT